MKLTARSLPLTVLLYFCALGAVFASLYAALSVLTPTVYASLQEGGERPVSRLEELTASAREVRKALATPLPPVEPLGPDHQQARARRECESRKLPGGKLERRSARRVASSETSGARGGGFADFDRHKVQ